MSLLGRLQDMFGLSADYASYEDERGYVHEQEFDQMHAQSKGHQQDGIPPNNVIEMPGINALQSELVVMEPRMFEEIPEAILALRERKTVILNLTNMDADQAQRSVDYVAGGVFAMDGHQERIGANVFLFTPNCVQINNHTSNPPSMASPSPGFHNPFVPAPSMHQTLADRLDVRANQTLTHSPNQQF